MSKKPKLEKAYRSSDDIVAREIEGELIIVPLTSGIGGLEDALFTFNETGKAIWSRLDGKTVLSEIAADMADEFDALPSAIETDTLGLLSELLERQMVVEVEQE